MKLKKSWPMLYNNVKILIFKEKYKNSCIILRIFILFLSAIDHSQKS